jgi:hypothetical protein
MLPIAHAAEQKNAAALPPRESSQPPFSMMSKGWKIDFPS